MVSDITGRTVLITGASSGIGEALSSVFGMRNNHLVVVARRAGRLEALQRKVEAAAGVTVTPIVADLSTSDGANQVLEAVRKAGLQIDVLCNNAGYSVAGDFRDQPLNSYLDMLRVNVDSALALTAGLLPSMIERGYGRVLTVSSLAGALPAVRDHAVYAASKSFLIRLSLSLHAENASRGVPFTVACPGVVASEFHDRSGTAELVRKMPAALVMTAEKAAERCYEAVAQGRPFTALGWNNTVTLTLAKLLPLPWSLALFAGVR